MATSIGKASLTLTANSEKLSAGLDAANAKVRGYASKAKADASFNLKGVNWADITNGVDGVTPKISKLKSEVGSTGAGLLGLGRFAGPLAAGFIAAAGAVGTFSAAVNGVKELGAIGRQADSMGISSKSLMGLATAARMPVEEIGKMMTKAQVKVEEGGADINAALSKIGLNSDSLKGMGADQQFLAIADGFKSINNPAEQAAVAMKLFEEEGLKLLPTLQKGGAEIKALSDAAAASGNALDARQMQAVQRAAQALPKMEQAFSGLWNRFTVAMAPAVETVANIATKIVGKLQPVFDWMGRAAESTFAVVGPVLEEVVDGVGSAIEWVGGLFSSFTGLGSSIPTVGEAITGAFRFVGLSIGYTIDVAKAFGGALAYVGSYAVTAFGSVVQAIGEVIKLGAELPAEFGGNLFKDAAAAVDRFGEKATSAGLDMRAWGDRQIKAFGTNADAVDGWFTKLAAKKAEVTDPAPFQAMAAQVAISFDKLKLGAAIERNSKEEYAIRAQWESAGVLNQVSEAKQTNKLLGEANTNLKGVWQAISSLSPSPQFNG